QVRRQHLDGRLRQLVLQRPDRGRVMACALVRQVVAVYRGDDDVLEVHHRRGRSEPKRLERIGRPVGLARVDVAVAAGAGTRVAEDLERRRPAAPTLGDIRAARLLADRVEARAVDQLADVEVAGVRARRADLHPLRPARTLGTTTWTCRPPVLEPTLRIRSRRCQSPSAKQTVPLYAELPAGRSSEWPSERLPLMK